MLHITADDKLHMSKGDFCTRVDNGQLVAPQELVNILKRFGAQSAEDFVAYIQIFPTALCSALEWNIDELMQAEARLYEQLSGHVPADILEQLDLRPQSPYGVTGRGR